jgi:hypothetical protein
MATAVVNQAETTSRKVDAKCPSCSAALKKNAVLCVACGYHLKHAVQLSTSVEKRSEEITCLSEPLGPEAKIDSNPYAPPQTIDDQHGRFADGEPTLKLNERALRLAERIVSDAETHLPIMVALMCLGPLALVLFPWYGYRLYQWYTLNNTFIELREPNSLSPHVDLALRFQKAPRSLLRATFFGASIWGAIIMIVIARLFGP